MTNQQKKDINVLSKEMQRAANGYAWKKNASRGNFTTEPKSATPVVFSLIAIIAVLIGIIALLSNY